MVVASPWIAAVLACGPSMACERERVDSLHAAEAPRGSKQLRVGVVVDSLSGEPIVGARLQFPDASLEQRTGSGGRFRWSANASPGWIYVSRVGFRPRLVIPASADTSLTIHLVPLPQSLARVVIEEDGLPGWLRRERGTSRLADARRSGRLLLREDIRRRGSPFLTQVLEGVPGLRVDGEFVYVPRARGLSVQAECGGVVVFLDGVSQGAVDSINQIARPSDLEAIEVFVGPSSIPRAFAGPQAGCGVIALWTAR